MLRVIVMNAKGGCGKTTVATNLASYCVSQGCPTALFDYDSQGSCSHWLKTRPQELGAIHGVAAYKPPENGVTRSWQLRIPEQTRYVIKDTPAGFAGAELDGRIQESDVILIPVLPSAIDIHSTADFIRDLLLIGKARLRGRHIAIIANRTRARTRSLQKLERFLNSLDIPVIAQVRDTQNYLRAAELGRGVCELGDYSARRDAAPWADILAWLQRLEAPGDTPPQTIPRVLPLG